MTSHFGLVHRTAGPDNPALAMAVLDSFATPRTKPIPFETLTHASTNLLTALFVNLKSTKQPAVATSSTAASSGGAAAAVVDPPNLVDQLQPDSHAHNPALATQARQQMAIALQTHRSVDAEIESKRISLLDSYLPFLRTILAQHLELDDDAVRTKNEKTSEVEWCTILLTGARPTTEDRVPYFNYRKLDLQQELAHALFVSRANDVDDRRMSVGRAEDHMQCARRSLASRCCVCWSDSRQLSLPTCRFTRLPRDAVGEYGTADLVQGPTAWVHFESFSRCPRPRPVPAFSSILVTANPSADGASWAEQSNLVPVLCAPTNGVASLSHPHRGSTGHGAQSCLCRPVSL
jgi:hypothetical protein